jgi:hypothetical protein
MKKLAIIILTFMISIPSAFAEVYGFAVGIQATENQLNNRATEDIDSDATLGPGNTPGAGGQGVLDTIVNLSDDFEAGTLFAEYTHGLETPLDIPGGLSLGVTLGINVIPGDAEIKKRSIVQVDNDTTVPNEQTNTVKYSIDGHQVQYAQGGLVFNNGNTFLYGTIGKAKATVTAESVNVSSDDFTKKQNLVGEVGGVGIKHSFNVWNLFVKLDYQETDYDTLTYVTSNNTTVTADLDNRQGGFSIGRTF